MRPTTLIHQIRDTFRVRPQVGNAFRTDPILLNRTDALDVLARTIFTPDMTPAWAVSPKATSIIGRRTGENLTITVTGTQDDDTLRLTVDATGCPGTTRTVPLDAITESLVLELATDALDTIHAHRYSR